MHPAFKELEKIMLNSNNLEREDSYNKWLQRWVHQFERKQLVLNQSRLFSDDHDFICEHITKRCLDDMIENNATDFSIDKNSYNVKITTILTKPKN